jgi:hypothetical protein
MAPRTIPSTTELLAREYNRLFQATGRAYAAVMGRSPKTVDVGDNTEVELWLRDTGIDAVEWLRNAQNGQVDTSFFENNPDPFLSSVGARIQELCAAGLMIEAAMLAKHPFREALYANGRPSAKDQRDYCRRMNARADKYKLEHPQRPAPEPPRLPSVFQPQGVPPEPITIPGAPAGPMPEPLARGFASLDNDAALQDAANLAANPPA